MSGNTYIYIYYIMQNIVKQIQIHFEQINLYFEQIVLNVKGAAFQLK